MTRSKINSLTTKAFDAASGRNTVRLQLQIKESIIRHPQFSPLIIYLVISNNWPQSPNLHFSNSNTILKNYNNVRNSENTKILSGAKLSIFPPKREAQHNFESFFVRQVTEELYEPMSLIYLKKLPLKTSTIPYVLSLLFAIIHFFFLDF